MSDIDRANKAKAVLESPAFTDAFSLVRNEYIRILESPTTDAAIAESVRHRLAALRDVRMNLEAAISSGKLEVFRAAQEEKRKKSPLRFFR